MKDMISIAKVYRKENPEKFRFVQVKVQVYSGLSKITDGFFSKRRLNFIVSWKE